MPTLLIVDDEPNVLYSLQAGLESDEVRVLTAKTARQGLAALAKEHPDAVIVDVRLPDLSGLELFDRIHQTDPHLPVIVVTAFASTETAIEAMKRGAFEYLLKPVDLHHLREVVDKAFALRRMRTVPAVFADDPAADDADRIVGQSPPMQEVYKVIGRFAPQDVTVLVLGESGTGKELVARAIHEHSPRKERALIKVNCSAVPESLFESEFFGHARGAFTGALKDRIGRFELADGGTLFLDEIGEIPGGMQAKLLRVLQEQEIERVGETRTRRVNVRIIAATNRDLKQEVEAGRFRQDLFYRLGVFPIEIPPLRDRRQDIPPLTVHFARQAARRLNRPAPRITRNLIDRLTAHDWPGNVRELQNTLERAVILSQDGALQVELPVPRRMAHRTLEAPAQSSTPPGLMTREDLKRREREAIVAALEASGGRIFGPGGAAELLGTKPTTLASRLKALGIPRKPVP